MRNKFIIGPVVVALAFSPLAFSGPASAHAPAAAAPAAASAADDVEIQVKRMWFPNLTACMVVGAAGVAAGSWDRWLCSPQFPAGWRLYTNR